MKNLKRFLTIDDCYKNYLKKIIPDLAEWNDVEMEYRNGLYCPDCGEMGGSALFYRTKGDQDWFQAKKVTSCSKCRDRQAFENYQQSSLNQQKTEIDKRLTAEYFLIPQDLQSAGFQNYEKTNSVTTKALNNSIDYVKRFNMGDKYNLLIMGNPGTGKSFLSVAIARNLRIKGEVVGFMTTAQLLTKIKSTYSNGTKKTQEGILQDLQKIDLLILDDLGSESVSGSEDWRKSLLFEVVNSRIGKPTIYTSNLTDTDLPLAVGDRVFSRLYNNTKFIDLFTVDYRKKLKI